MSSVNTQRAINMALISSKNYTQQCKLKGERSVFLITHYILVFTTRGNPCNPWQPALSSHIINCLKALSCGVAKETGVWISAGGLVKDVKILP